jgi:CHAD domain-containing protein
MNDAAPAHVLLTTALRKLIVTARDTRRRLLDSEAAHQAGNVTDAEALHDFRVSLRRMRTFLRAARTLWNGKQIVRIESELRYFARTTGTLRDDEVLRDTLASLALPPAAQDEIGGWLARRARAARSRRRVIMRIVREGPSDRDVESSSTKAIRPLDRVLDKLDLLLGTEPTNALSAVELAQYAVARAIRDVEQAAQADVHDAMAMHRLRIREKRLRYTAELFTNELGESASRLAHYATRMQRRLGELHDVDDALVAVARARGLAKTTQRVSIASLRVARAACAAKVEPHLIESRRLAAQHALSCNESLSNSST